MNCTTSQYKDMHKMFFIQRSEIEGRFDPKMALYNRKVRHSLYPKSRLKDILTCKPQYGAGEPGVERQSEFETRYIRITDIDEYGLISQEVLGATANNIEEKYILNENDLLIARSGATVGKAYIHKSTPYDCIFAGYLIRFVVNRNKALPDYVFSYTQLNAYKEWINAIQRPSGQPNINSEEYQSLEIPLPDMVKQQEIVDFINSAYLQKRQKDSDARNLLESIDEYLLEELEITLPKVETNLSNRIFFINREKLENRLDPTVYRDGIKLKSNKYDNVKISNIVLINPSSSFQRKDNCLPISFISMEMVDEIFSEVTSVGETTVGRSSSFTKFIEGDLLWAKITPCMQNGKSAIARNLLNGSGCGSTEFYVLRPKDNRLSIDYLHVILHMKCVRETAMLYFGGSAGQQRVPKSFLENFSVPFPPLTKQQEIANHVSAIRQQAKRLQEEGKAILENAKKDVERMIIGE